MSNTVTIQRTEFKDIPQGYTSYGYRMYDEYDAVYGNILFQSDMVSLPEDFLNKIIQYFDDKSKDMLDFALNEKHGIVIDDTYYTLTWENEKYNLKKA